MAVDRDYLKQWSGDPEYLAYLARHGAIWDAGDRGKDVSVEAITIEELERRLLDMKGRMEQ